MSSPNENWYSHFVAQSRNANIYTLIHHYLTPGWNPNHELDFVTVRRSQLPASLQQIPPDHLSKKLKQKEYCFPGNDYILLHNYKLTEYLYYAKWATITEDSKGREFIELRYDWTDEAQHYFNYPLAYYGKMQPQKPKPEILAIQTKPPESEEEAALLKAYDLLQKGIQKEEALQYAQTGEAFLDKQHIAITENSAEPLQQLARRMMGYNIVAMVYAWNDRIDDAAAVDVLYIFHPPLWDYLEDYIRPYLEMLMVKKREDYLHYLFKDKDFRKRFLSHYEAYVSLFVNDAYELTSVGAAIDIINRINNTSDAYK
ncbi:NOC3 family protein [Parafilimonas terrae]|jgi:hypothetical protein|uniref:Uncharacterized protein n=1 Tax=Parafilimonas terrae TaxID=1465490 RepID=A0A1I5UED1_9BACT|nr:hypothetical protein [Parafilimonas terrae]SFP93625.1 hypothetical protein SAMN05444277_103237 [Parafilimonas terrae]